MITFRCDGCGMEHKSSDAFQGTRAKCLRCGAVIQVPGESAAAKKAKKKARKPVPELDEPLPQVKDEPEPEAREVKDETIAERIKTLAKRYRKHLMIGGGALVLLVAAYFMFRAPSRPAPQKKKDAEPVVEAPKPVEKPKEEPVKKSETSTEVLHMTATKLIREHRADVGGTNTRYQKKMFEVRGHVVRVLDAPPSPRLEKDAPPPKDLPPSPGPTLVIAASESEETPIFCNIPAGVPKDRLPPDLRGLPVTIRATYLGDLKFQDGVVTRWQAKADDLYKGKTIELLGVVETNGEVKNLRLDAFNTESMLQVPWFARGSEEKPLTQFDIGQTVVLRALCTGRRFKKVELHNTQISAMRPGVIEYPRFVADYEADLLDEPLVRFPEYPIAIAANALVKEYEQSVAAATEKYHRRVLMVSGLVEKVNRYTREIILESDTNQAIKVKARFTQSQIERITRQKRLVLRGVCTDINQRSFVVLENSMLELSPRLLALMRTGPILLPEHYPFRAGEQLTYDIAQHSATTKTVSRLTMTFKDPNLVDFVNTAQGTINGTGLRTGQVLWLPKAKLAPPAVAQYRMSESFIELGTTGPTGEMSWEPVIKLGAKEGESWTWDSPFGTCVYTVTDFRKTRGQAAAHVKKLVQNGLTVTESTHLYELGIGETERTTYQATAKQPRKLVGEMLLR